MRKIGLGDPTISWKIFEILLYLHSRHLYKSFAMNSISQKVVSPQRFKVVRSTFIYFLLSYFSFGVEDAVMPSLTGANILSDGDNSQKKTGVHGGT